MATIKIKDEQELKQKFLELAHAVNNMRHAQKYFQIHFGGNAKQRKEYWEDKVDIILNQLNMSEHQNIKAIIVFNK